MKVKKNGWMSWLIRSTFGYYDYYEMPKNLCGFFWMLVLSIITLPICWMSHVANLIRKQTDIKAYVGAIVLCIGILGTAVYIFPSEGLVRSPFDRMTHLEVFLSMYALAPILALALGVIIAAVIVCVAGIVWCFTTVIDMFRPGGTFGNNKRNEWGEREPGMIIKYIRAVKGKYCPLIEYVDPKSKTNEGG